MLDDRQDIASPDTRKCKVMTPRWSGIDETRIRVVDLIKPRPLGRSV
jgi:hypothetical protein